MSFALFLWAPHVNALVGWRVVLGQWPCNVSDDLVDVSGGSPVCMAICVSISVPSANIHGELLGFFPSWLCEKIESLAHCKLLLACPYSHLFFSSDLSRCAAFWGARLGPEDTWACNFVTLPFFFPLAPGRLVISWSLNSQRMAIKFPDCWWWACLCQAHSCWGIPFPRERADTCLDHRQQSQVLRQLWALFVGVFCCDSVWPLGASHYITPQMVGRLHTVCKVGKAPSASCVCSWGRADGVMGRAAPCAWSEPHSSCLCVSAKAAAALKVAFGMGLGVQEGCAALHRVTPRRCRKTEKFFVAWLDKVMGDLV